MQIRQFPELSRTKFRKQHSTIWHLLEESQEFQKAWKENDEVLCRDIAGRIVAEECDTMCQAGVLHYDIDRR